MAARGPPILMSFVLDASITASWALQDEGHPDADAALFRLRSQPAQVPSLWWFEVRNALFMCERRRRITEAETAAFLLDLGFLPISLDRSPDEARILGLARTHKLTLYDAAYLELSQRASLPLATLDAALRRAAEQVGVALVLPS